LWRLRFYSTVIVALLLLVVFLQGSAVLDGDGGPGFAQLGAVRADFLHNLVPLGDFAEHHVSAIQPGSFTRANKKLTPVGVRSRVGH
jgi:hypothetical protein